jgi:carboxylate-amine ligase
MNCLILLTTLLTTLAAGHAISNVHKILEMGTGADRQLAVYKETDSLIAVADYIPR